jgi:methyltransferase (TIGR00027 family)
LSRVSPLSALVARYADWRAPGARTSGIARTWLIDEWLRAAVGDDIKQVVILGAGFDCRAYRLPWPASVTFFEVDQPATLAVKLDRLGDALPELRMKVHFVPIDFNREPLREALADAGLDPRRQLVCLWEGVTNYLSAEGVDSVLAFVSGCAPGSRLIFTYVHRGAIDGSVSFEGAARLRSNVERLGEAWTFGFVPEALPESLRARGLRLEKDLGAQAYRRDCFGAASERMRGYEFYHVAMASVSRD